MRSLRLVRNRYWSMDIGEIYFRQFEVMEYQVLKDKKVAFLNKLYDYVGSEITDNSH
jgi:hypothetical protein